MSPQAEAAERLRPQEAAREARGRQWREQILAAAVQQLEKRGARGLSMQAIAEASGVSVGVIYKYFDSKEELTREVIIQVLEELERRIPAAMEDAGDDPLERLSAGFEAYCRVIDRHHQAALVTYRESRYLSVTSRDHLKASEVAVGRPLHAAAATAAAQGMLRGDPDLLASNLALAAHAWALKRWFFEPRYDLDGYIVAQREQLIDLART